MTAHDKVPLSPISFLTRAADVYPSKHALKVSDGQAETYESFRRRAASTADQLRSRGIEPGQRVAVLSRNSPQMLLFHFAIPGAQAVLVPLNTRLSAEEYGYILADAGARILFVEAGLAERVEPILGQVDVEVVTLPDAVTGEISPAPLGEGLEDWMGQPVSSEAGLQLPASEWDPIAINYTSGTTGSPKGAVYTHRGAYLNSFGVALELGLRPESVYLWSLPMFHCNGWCFTWAVTALGATHLTLAEFDAAEAIRLIEEEGVTHLCGAPVVLNSLATVADSGVSRTERRVRIATGGAPPSPSTISAMNTLGLEVVHLYGLTETYGPSVVCEPQLSWTDLDVEERASVLSRQGVRTINIESVRVVDSKFIDVPRDGESMGEIAVRGNTVIGAYHGEPELTKESFRKGYFMTGDLAVVHPDGYIEIRDRRKDVIISGGENVSSIEIENVLMEHPSISEAAVVAVPHSKWGEVPAAFVSLQPGEDVTDKELIEYVRHRLAHFKAPKAVFFDDLPKTSTGKIQKFELRSLARSLYVE